MRASFAGRIIHRAAIGIGLLCSVGASPILAQQVRVSVVDGATNTPLPAVTVTASTKDSLIGGAFTAENGVAVFAIARRGPVVVTARRIGFSPARMLINLSSDSAVTVTLKLDKLGNVLTAVVSTAETECQDLSTGAGRISRVWEDIRSALESNRLTENSGLIRMEIERYEQTLDTKLLHPSARVSTRREVWSNQPFAAALPSEMESRGYVIASGDALVYYAPDARTLLSDEFARSHCYYMRQGSGSDNEMVGLAFEPRPEISTANVAGTLWVDRRSGALSRLVYHYVNTGSSVSTKESGGRIDFQQLPGGAWIISHWQVLSPRIGRFQRITRPYYVREVVDTLLGFHEIGGNARPLVAGEVATGTEETRDTVAKTVTRADDSSFPVCSPSEAREAVTIRGAIRDGRGQALNGSKVVIEWSEASLSSGNRKQVTAASRGQVIEVEPATNGLYSVCGLPLGVAYRVHFAVAGRKMADTTIQSVSIAQIFSVDFSPQVISDQDLAAYTLLGLVRDDATPAKPIPNAEIRVQSWSARTDSSGRFSITGIPPGRQSVTVRSVGFVQLKTFIDFSGPKGLGRIFVLRPTKTALDTVEVRADRALPYLESFEDRRVHGFGSYITRDRLENERDRKTADILKALPGLRIVTMTGGDAAVASARSDGQLGKNPRGGDASDRARGAGNACYVQVFIDGVRVFAPGPDTPLFNINSLSPNMIEGVEYYRGPAETPIQYTTLDSECGTLLIWTRRGDQSR